MILKSVKKRGFVQHVKGESSDTVRDVDMVPMINVVFLLLTFFIIAGVFRSVNPVAVKLPETMMAVQIVDSVSNEITIDAAGSVSINGKSYSVETLIEAISPSDETTDWVVRADANAPANSVIEILAAAKSAGLKEIGLQAVSRQ